MDLTSYRDQLRKRIDSMQLPTMGATEGDLVPPQAGGAMQPTPSPQPPNTPPFTDTGEGPWVDEGGEPAPPADQAADLTAGQGGAGPSPQQGTGGAPGAPGGAKPPFEIKYKEGALDEVKGFGDVVKAMQPKSQNKYMDWWEQQYGSIDQKWDALQSELGKRPDPKGKLSRKEKFGLLMEFGLELMRASQPGQDTGGGATTAAYNAVRNTQAERKGDQRDWDIQNQLVTQGRQKDLSAIGSRGQAMATQSRMDADQSRSAKDLAIAGRPPKKQTINTDQGVMDISGDEPKAMTVDGKPLTNLKVGSRGGAAHDTRPAEQKKYEHLVSLGVGDETARRIAYRQSSGDPRKDYKDVLNATLRANGGDQDAAKQGAQEFIDMAYGPDAINNARTPDINKPNQINSQTDYDALPVGATYTAPDGKLRKKQAPK